jgi:hypothetical protein
LFLLLLRFKAEDGMKVRKHPQARNQTLIPKHANASQVKRTNELN